MLKPLKRRPFFTLAIIVIMSCSALAQVTTQTTAGSASDSQAVLLANQAQVALSGGTISDIQIQATSKWLAGSTQAVGVATLKAKGITEARLELSAGQFSRSEIRNDLNGPNGQWLDAAGLPHSVALHNCWGPAAWFAPHAIVQALSASGAVVRYLGQETRNMISVDHLRAYRNYTASSAKLSSDIQLLSTFHLYLDSSTHLPLAIVFNIHPDDDYGRDVPVEIRFSDYRNVNGAFVPFRIQRLLQGVLNLDLTVTSANINTGLADSEFALR